MFKRTCNSKTVDVYNTANDMLEGWFGFNRKASADVVKAFEFDPKNFLYYRSRAITADEMNANGDVFPYAEVRKAYKTFIGKGIFFNHNSDDPENSCGIILDANFVEPANKHAYVELLSAIDRQLAESKYPGLVHRIETGMISGTSMGALAARAECCVCNNMARRMEDLCEHMNPENLHYCKGRIINASTNEYGAEKNYDITFIEDSIVHEPADSTAHIFEVYANKVKQGDTSKEVIDILIDALNKMHKFASK